MITVTKKYKLVKNGSASVLLWIGSSGKSQMSTFEKGFEYALNVNELNLEEVF